MKKFDLHLRRGFWQLLICFLGLGAASLKAQNPQSAFEEANKLYYEGKFSDATVAYEKLLASRFVSPALYFNLGNAWFKSGQIGRAIVAYKMARKLTPHDPDVRANLQFARNQIQGPSYSPNRWERELNKLSLDEWTLLAAGAVWLWLLLVTALQWRPSWKLSLRGYVIGLALVSVAFCCCLAASIYQTRVVQTAVLIAPEAVVRSGPLDESQNAFVLHDGAELRVLDRKDQWLLVTTGPRRVGWLRLEQVQLASK